MSPTATHPAWCALDLCDVDPDLPANGGAHRSQPLEFDVAPLTIGYSAPLQVTAASLWQIERSWPTSVYLVLEAPGRPAVSLPLEKAAGVLEQLSQLVDSARTARTY